MSSSHHITREAFASTFPRLIEGRLLLPKKRSELQMLLISVTLTFEPGRIYSEPRVNEHIREWVSRFGSDLSVDHVTLRRYLIDEGILIRDEFGSSYQLNDETPFFSFDPSIRNLDLEGLVAQAQKARAARKRAFLAARKQE